MKPQLRKFGYKEFSAALRDVAWPCPALITGNNAPIMPFRKAKGHIIQHQWEA
jgi:hypothetical protein